MRDVFVLHALLFLVIMMYVFTWLVFRAITGTKCKCSSVVSPAKVIAKQNHVSFAVPTVPRVIATIPPRPKFT